MRILVTGVGRSGTCLLIEVVRGLGIVNFSRKVEDRQFFKYKPLPQNYGTKLATDQRAFSMKNIKKAMEEYQDLYLVFSLRHPVDTLLSKIRRGQKLSDGGERKERLSFDATVETAIFTIKDFYEKHEFAIRNYPNRTCSIKLEDLILQSRITVNKVADFFRVRSTKKAFRFYKFDRNKYHLWRYKRRLDPSQVGNYKRWDTIYEGFFKDKKGDVDRAKKELHSVIKGLGYEI